MFCNTGYFNRVKNVEIAEKTLDNAREGSKGEEMGWKNY